MFAGAGSASIAELKRIGINRLSLGPGLLKASVTAMRRVAIGLRDEHS